MLLHDFFAGFALYSTTTFPETGLGGRFDSTNICAPVATCITSIALDHVSVLGDTVEKIAFEKV